MKKMTKQEKQDLLNDLLHVGPSKPVGYLPLDTLTQLCQTRIQDMLDYAKKRRLKAVVYQKGECDTHSGALYLYDERALLALLRQHQAVLKKADIPWDDAAAYIRYISRYLVSPNVYPQAYEVVGRPFHDKRFR